MTAAFGFSETRLLRDDAIAIWRAGVDAVDSATLVRNSVCRDGETLTLADICLDTSQLGRICVVGGGKASVGMGAGFERAIGTDLLSTKVFGWLNAPADCVRPLEKIHVHAARPGGVNEPTEAGVEGTAEIMRMVSSLGPDDVCVVLLSGGASALLPLPAEGISLTDKQAVTRMLSRGGASIGELNCVRKQLSRIKGGRLAQACTAGTLIALVISDIVGDPLDVIGSGPTVPDSSTASEALEVLRRFDPSLSHTPRSVVELLERIATESTARDDKSTAKESKSLPKGSVFNRVIGNNRVALDACAARARALGYEVLDVESDVEGIAAEVGVELAGRCRDLAAAGSGKRCVLSGGEPVVLIERSATRQKGGRNQELALAAVAECWEVGMRGMCILSGGTDGEDGPTDAAGAIADEEVIEAGRRIHLEPAEFLRDHNSYEFFERTGGLLKTGPTHTNVMDVRVALVSGEQVPE